MASASNTASKGELLELRLARLLFSEGAFVRRSIELRAGIGSQFTITDLDVLSVYIAPDLSVRRTIAECKSGLGRGASKAPDRLLWGRGLRSLLRADSHIVVTSRKINADVRALADRLDAEVLDERDLDRREKLRGLRPDSAYGSHDPALLAVVRDHYAAIRKNDELKRAWRFCLADGWLMEAASAIKRSLGALQLLARKHSQDTTDAEAQAIEWLLGQSCLVFCLAAVEMAGHCYRRPPELFEPWFVERMSGGTVPAQHMERISRDVDEYIVAVLAKIGATPAQQVDAMGALAPEPPRYAQPLLELVRRLAAEPSTAAGLPRALDWRLAEYSSGRADGVAPDSERTSAMLRNIAAFLRGQVRVPSELLGPLMTPFAARSMSSSDSGPASDNDEPSMSETEIAGSTDDPGTRIGFPAEQDAPTAHRLFGDIG